VTLSAQSAVVASLGGSTGATVYTPTGLLSSLQQAGRSKSRSACLNRAAMLILPLRRSRR
jgi:hypothetical protein